MNRGSPDFEYRATRDLMLAGASTTANAGLSRGFALLAPLAAAVCFSGRAHAGPIAPNRGGATVLKNSTTATTGYVDTPVTQRVDNYSTTLLAFLNGNQFFSETFPAPLTDPTVQAAISQDDAILSGDGASFGGPLLLSNASVLQSSVTAPPPAYTCETVESAPGEYVTGSVVTDTVTFGRATIMAGDCQSGTFTVLTGQLDINLNSDDEFAVPRTIVTTGTYLTSQTYEISGTTADASVPEPAPAGLLLPGLGAVWCRRSRGSNPGCVVHSFGTNLRTVIQVGTNVCVFVADPDSDDIAAFNSTDFAAPARTTLVQYSS